MNPIGRLSVPVLVEVFVLVVGGAAQATDLDQLIPGLYGGAGHHTAVGSGHTLQRAGHPAPLIRRRAGTVETTKVQQGPLLGFERREGRYPKLRSDLKMGDVLLLYTDGIAEAPARDGRPFGTKRLCETFAEEPFPPELKQWTTSLRETIEAFCGDREQEDDITLALLRAT